MIADRDGTTALSSGISWPGSVCWPVAHDRRMQRFWCFAMKSPCYVAGPAAATVVGGSGGVRRAGPVAVPGWPTASDRHPCHGIAVARRPGQMTLDSAPTPPHRGSFHRTQAGPAGAAPGLRELDLGLPADPRRTRRARLLDCGEHGVVDPQSEPASIPHLVAMARQVHRREPSSTKNKTTAVAGTPC